MVDLKPYEKLHSIAMLKGILRRWWKVDLAFADATGYVIDHAEGRLAPPNNEFCRLALLSREGFRRCNESLRVVAGDLGARCNAAKAAQGRRAVVHRCHLDFDLVGCPIVLEGELAGLLFVGGSIRAPLSPVDHAKLVAQIRELAGVALDGTTLARAASELPVVGEPEIERLCDLLEFAVDEIQTYHAGLVAKERELEVLRGEPATRQRFPGLVGTSPAMLDVFRLLEKIVESESTVLINGESGTGKELVARAIHFGGPRAKRPFVVQNCSAFNDNLLESALFGHTKGSFTGAIKDQKGLFEVADGGTFFLDEVGDMSPALQVKLLRVLQEGTFTPVGATEPRSCDVRVIAATHKDLMELVRAGQFREDLYYRIHVIRVAVPPLRERLDDLELLVEHFQRKHWRPRGKMAERPPRLSPRALETMRRYGWPGNVRELENEIERLLVLGADLDELPEELLSTRVREATATIAPVRPQSVRHDGTLHGAVEALEREMIAQGLIRTHWNKSLLAKELGISRSNLIAKVDRFGLEKK